MEIVRILFWLISGDLKEGGSFFFIDGDDVADHPLTACEWADNVP